MRIRRVRFGEKMCTPMSSIVTKNKIFWSEKTESHHEIIDEFGLKEQNVRGNYTLVPVELVPPNEDYRLPISKWVFSVDVAGYERDLPKWWDAKKYEKLVRNEAKRWRKLKVMLPREERERIDSGHIVAIYGTVDRISDSAKVDRISGSAKVGYIFGSATVDCIFDSATVDCISGSATVDDISGSATVDCISDSAKVGYISDSAKVGYISGSATVDRTSDLAKIGAVYGKAIICSYNNLSPSILKSSQAVLIDRTKDPVVCHVGKKRTMSKDMRT